MSESRKDTDFFEVLDEAASIVEGRVEWTMCWSTQELSLLDAMAMLIWDLQEQVLILKQQIKDGQ